MNIFLFANASLPRIPEISARLVQEARAQGLEVVSAAQEADVILTLGGDGTILRAVHTLPRKPLLGFNCGGLGYLASVEEAHFSEALQLLAQHAFTRVPRTLLQVRKGSESYLALNEVALVHGSSGHAVVLDVVCEGQPMTCYLADGLLIATPTGSTAYSLSAGGPILMPTADVFVLTPLNPHALASRPVVLPHTVHLTVTVRARTAGRNESIDVVCDGKTHFTCATDEAVEISRATEQVELIEFAHTNPYQTLSRKLGWSGHVASKG